MKLLVVGLLIFLVLAVTALRFFAHSAAYYPLRYPAGFWDSQAQAGATDVWLTTSDNVRLHAWWIPAAKPHFATVFLHGNGGNLTHRFGHMRAIPAAGSSLLIPDYRGYGKSDGKPSESGLYADATAAYDWLLAQGYPPTRIVIHGESLGTAVAVDLAARKPCAGVVLEAPFNSASQVAARALPLLGPLIMRDFDSKSKIARIRAPLFFLHGSRDEVIPYELGRDLFNAAPEPKSFWTIETATHNDIVQSAGAEYIKKLSAFYATLKSN